MLANMTSLLYMYSLAFLWDKFCTLCVRYDKYVMSPSLIGDQLGADWSSLRVAIPSQDMFEALSFCVMSQCFMIDMRNLSLLLY